MAKWIDKPGLSAGQLADGDKVLIGDVSEAVGSRDKTVTLGDLRAFLGAGVTVAVTQASHGLAVGDVIRHNGTSYVKATADTASNAEAVGVVTSVPDANSFAYQTAGHVSGLSGLTAGELYYLQDDGSLDATPGTVEKPVLIAVSATSAVIILAISGQDAGGVESLDDLDDVDTSGAQDGDALVYDADTSTWKPGAGGGGGAAWGGITGTLSDQTDLQAALDAKLGKSATVQSYAGNHTLDSDDSGAYVRITAAGTVTLPDSLDTGFQCVIVNATDSDTVALSAATTLTLPSGFEPEIQNRRAVTVVHVGSNVWEAHGALVEEEEES